MGVGPSPHPYPRVSFRAESWLFVCGSVEHLLHFPPGGRAQELQPWGISQPRFPEDDVWSTRPPNSILSLCEGSLPPFTSAHNREPWSFPRDNREEWVRTSLSPRQSPLWYQSLFTTLNLSTQPQLWPWCGACEGDAATAPPAGTGTRCPCLPGMVGPASPWRPTFFYGFWVCYMTTWVFVISQCPQLSGRLMNDQPSLQ